MTPAPLVRELALPDPQAALAALAGRPYPFLLHSALPDARGRWSFFGADPFQVVHGGDEVLRAAFRAAATALGGAAAGLPPVPFAGGAVGYWAYDFGRRLERLPEHARDDLGLPDAVAGLYDVVGVFEHASGRAWLTSTGLPLAGREGAAHAAARLDAFRRDLEAPPRGPTPPPDAHHVRQAISTFGRDAYLSAVEAVREHIRRGDIFQANLSQRWTLALDRGEPLPRALALAAALARVSPAPFAATLGCGDHAIVSASPERFLELRGSRIETRPIKGTRPRDPDPARDAALAAELLASAKDRAENVMIVDVLRNDLGRVAETGSVTVPELCALETFPQVFHLVSAVRAALRPSLDAFDLLHACFPGGSITGAPKIRAMEVIERLEPVRRHIYTGAIGCIDWRGDADWNIAIRTALVTPDGVRFAAGGGITADSDPAAEYDETLHKAAGLAAALAETFGPVALEPAPAGAAR
jgi:para-aminobenzoate synthetase component 1